MKKHILIAMFVSLRIFIAAQENQTQDKPEFGVLFGLSQPILGSGFNYELNYYTKRLVFDWSHGIGLQIRGSGIVGEMKEQNLVAYIPYTIGFGAGVRLSEWLNIRIEPKLHRFHVYYDGDAMNSENEITEYSTVTLGIGVYGKWMPFKKESNYLKGIVVAPSVRFWPNISSTVEGDAISYDNAFTKKNEEHKVMNIGFNNTPFFANVSIGYLFSK